VASIRSLRSCSRSRTKQRGSSHLPEGCGENPVFSAVIGSTKGNSRYDPTIKPKAGNHEPTPERSLATGRITYALCAEPSLFRPTLNIARRKAAIPKLKKAPESLGGFAWAVQYFKQAGVATPGFAVAYSAEIRKCSGSLTKKQRLIGASAHRRLPLKRLDQDYFERL
jgi:hypothetical protein